MVVQLVGQENNNVATLLTTEVEYMILVCVMKQFGLRICVLMLATMHEKLQFFVTLEVLYVWQRIVLYMP